eukprot:3612275-Rhodomonas_salina.2
MAAFCLNRSPHDTAVMSWWFGKLIRPLPCHASDADMSGGLKRKCASAGGEALRLRVQPPPRAAQSRPGWSLSVRGEPLRGVRDGDL